MALRAASSPVLTSEAVLALQDAEGSEANARRRPDASGGKADTLEETQSGADDPLSSGAEADGESDPASGSTGGATDGALEAPQDEDEDADGDGLNEAEEEQVDELAQRDREVRAHEQAHARAGGAHAGAPSYTFQQGPDGKRYAVGGEVQIDTSKERTPEATIRKMQTVIRAATAPAEPSSQDLKVAQQARGQLAEAQAERRKEAAEPSEEGDSAVDGHSAAERPGTADGQTGPSDRGASVRSGQGSDESSGETAGSGEGRPGSTPEGHDAISAYRSALDRSRESAPPGRVLVA
ncbi:hypothetical protein DCO57_06750 [Labrenzia sp. 011]|nr:hypothetical protein DCO57_06750 [Labrenzia sp. 011]